MTTVTYQADYLTALEGTGAVAGPADATNTSTSQNYSPVGWLQVTGFFGRVSSKINEDADMFLRFIMGPTHYQSSVVIPAGSTIDSARIRMYASGSSGNTTYRCMLLDRTPTSDPETGYVAGGTWASGSDTVGATWAEFENMHITHDVRNGGARVDTTGAGQVQGPVGPGISSLSPWRLTRHTTTPATRGLHSIAQHNATENSVFDEVRFYIDSAGSTGNVWVEVWTGDGPQSPDTGGSSSVTGTGTKVAESDHIALSTLTTGGIASFLFTTHDPVDGEVDLGSGTQPAWFVLTGDHTASNYDVTVVKHNDAAIEHNARLIGEATGFHTVFYPLNVSWPFISSATTDVLTGNEFGSNSFSRTSGSWSNNQLRSLWFQAGGIAALQEWIDDPSYVEGDVLGATLEGASANLQTATAHISPSSSKAGPWIEINFTEPVAAEQEVDITPTIMTFSAPATLSLREIEGLVDAIVEFRMALDGVSSELSSALLGHPEMNAALAASPEANAILRGPVEHIEVIRAKIIVEKTIRAGMSLQGVLAGITPEMVAQILATSDMQATLAAFPEAATTLTAAAESADVVRATILVGKVHK